MIKYKYIIHFPTGDDDSYLEDGEDGLFDTEDEAEDAALEAKNNYRTGSEILHMSNPGDYDDYSDEDFDVDIEEVEIDE